MSERKALVFIGHLGAGSLDRLPRIVTETLLKAFARPLADGDRWLTPEETAAYLLGAPAESFPVESPQPQPEARP